ncbi:MAG: substrate-binding domain-containing protein [Hyphomicrobiaceae bacterium]|nr:substrate-binding domain-containing protein [Hyphomicrobiaceae bacterium]
MTGERAGRARADLPWPREAAEAAEPACRLVAPCSNIVLDIHGDPARARLVVFSDGNHHMALAETIRAFAAAHPDIGDVLYLTTPPRILIAALASGRLSLGHLTLSLRPHVFISPREVLGRLHSDGLIGPPRVFAASRGTAILVRKGNPLGVRTLEDLLRPDVRLALSNPVTETASFTVYAEAIRDALKASPQVSTSDQLMRHLESGQVVKSRLIHHREIPEILAEGRADASLVYTHLALRYARVFPELFEMIPATAGPVTTYAVACVAPAGDFGEGFAAYLVGREVGRIYEAHGLQAAGAV